MNDSVRIVGMTGRLRKASVNRAAFRAAVQLVPHGSALDIFDFEGIPPFNADQERAFPLRAKELKATVSAADAILIVRPEYNYSVPGVLKNAIDWASRKVRGMANQLVSWALRWGCWGPPGRNIICVKFSSS